MSNVTSLLAPHSNPVFLDKALTDINISDSSNITNHDDDDFPHSNPLRGTAVLQTLLLLLMVVLMVAAPLGNLVNLYVILSSSQLRYSLSNFFVVSLCTCDLLAALLIMPLAFASYVLGYWPVGGLAGCQLLAFISSLFMFASTTTLSVIAAERYYAIRLPMHHAAHMSLCKTVGVVVGVWAWAAMMAALPLAKLGAYAFINPGYHCFFSYSSPNIHPVYIVMVVILCFFLPGLVISVMYIGIFRVARRASVQVHPFPRDTLAVSDVTARGSHCNSKQANGHQASDQESPRGHGVVPDPALDTAFATSTHQLGATGRSTVSLHHRPEAAEHAPCSLQAALCCRRDGGDGEEEGKALAAIRSREDSGIASQTSRQTLVAVSHKIIINEPSGSSMQIDDFRPQQSRLKAARILLLLLAAYVVLWGPFFGLCLYRVGHGPTSEPEMVELLALWLGFSTFAVNPFLYGWMNKTIREELLSFYHRLFKRWPCLCFCCLSLTSASSESLEDEMMHGPSDENFMQFLERTSRYSTSTEPESKGGSSCQTLRSKSNSLIKSQSYGHQMHHIQQGQQLTEHRIKECGSQLSAREHNV